MNLKNNIRYVLTRNIIRGDAKTILFCLLVSIIVLASGTNDQESISMYLDKLQSYSEHKLCNEQKNKIMNFYVNNQERDPLKNERRIARANFNSSRKRLKQQWSDVYKIQLNKNIEWHHIVPINAGGVNRWWNISPISVKNHKLIHASIEEKACFSHDFIHRRFMRFILKTQAIFFSIFKNYINKKGTNYAT